MRAAISLILLAVLLAGCGFKGPLYLPKPIPEAQKPAPKPAPAPAQVENKPEGE
jgi:predicted small lipoprotein YifL